MKYFAERYLSALADGNGPRMSHSVKIINKLYGSAGR